MKPDYLLDIVTHSLSGNEHLVANISGRMIRFLLEKLKYTLIRNARLGAKAHLKSIS